MTVKDDLDAAGFLDWVRAYQSLELDSDETLRAAVQSGMAAHKARIAAADPWTLLDIDWDRMHPDARSILDAPQDWSSADAYAPHGSDAWADIFNDWRGYKNLTPERAARRLGWAAAECQPEDALFWPDWVSIHMALAFGHIKTAGRCPADLASAARDVLHADMARVALADDGPDKAEFLRRMARYAGILQRYCDTV